MGVFWKWSCRRSSELYSYEKSVLSRFGPHRLRLGGEGPPRDFDLLPRRRHRFFFLRRMSASFADLEKSCEFVFHNFSFFICWAIRHPSFQADGGWLFSVIIDFSVFIRFSAQLSSTGILIYRATVDQCPKPRSSDAGLPYQGALFP